MGAGPSFGAVSASPLASTTPSPSASAAAPRLLAIALAAVYVIWGSTYLAMRVAVESLPPWSLAGSRFVCAGAVALAVARARGEPWPSARAWLAAGPTGVLLFAVGNGLVAVAEQSVPSGLAALVCSTTPLIACAMNALRGERPTRAEISGIALGVVGVLVLALRSPLGSAGLRGLVIVLAPFGFALGSLLSRARAAREGAATTTGFAAVAAPMVTGGVAMLVVAAVIGERLPASVPWRAAAAWSYLVVFGSLVGFSAYAWLLRNARPAVAMSYAYVNPIFAVLLGAAAYGEPLGATTAVSGLLVAAGVMIGVVRRR